MNELIENGFDEISFYQTHPYMKPYVGERYESVSHKKLLIIGESHYLPDSSTVHLNIDEWYKGICNLTEEEKEWCNTEHSRLYGYGKQFQQTIERDLRECFHSDFKDVASFNYFLRPSNKGRSFKRICNIKDRLESAKNFKKLIEVLKPDLIAFASLFVFDCVAWKNDFPLVNNGENFEDFAKRKHIEYVKMNHPARGWWRRRVRGEDKTSQQLFIDFLKEKWIR